MKHVHGPSCGHTWFRGRYHNTPHTRPEWTPAECWLAGRETALKAFRRDLKKHEKKLADRNSQRITWGDKMIGAFLGEKIGE